MRLTFGVGCRGEEKFRRNSFATAKYGPLLSYRPGSRLQELSYQVREETVAKPI